MLNWWAFREISVWLVVKWIYSEVSEQSSWPCIDLSSMPCMSWSVQFKLCFSTPPLRNHLLFLEIMSGVEIGLFPRCHKFFSQFWEGLPKSLTKLQAELNTYYILIRYLNIHTMSTIFLLFLNKKSVTTFLRVLSCYCILQLFMDINVVYGRWREIAFNSPVLSCLKGKSPFHILNLPALIKVKGIERFLPPSHWADAKFSVFHQGLSEGCSDLPQQSFLKSQERLFLSGIQFKASAKPVVLKSAHSNTFLLVKSQLSLDQRRTFQELRGM